MSGNLAYEMELREELIGGKDRYDVSGLPKHNWITLNIASIFKSYLRGKSCAPFADGTSVHLTEDDHFIPDVMIICDRSKIKDRYVEGAPDLVVEILSPSTAKNDRGRKLEVYAKCGVREYWIVSPEARTVEVYRNTGGVFSLHEIYYHYLSRQLEEMSNEERAEVVPHFKCSLYDDLEIFLADIFEEL